MFFPPGVLLSIFIHYIRQARNSQAAHPQWSNFQVMQTLPIYLKMQNILIAFSFSIVYTVTVIRV